MVRMVWSEGVLPLMQVSFCNEVYLQGCLNVCLRKHPVIFISSQCIRNAYIETPMCPSTDGRLPG